MWNKILIIFLIDIAISTSSIQSSIAASSVLSKSVHFLKGARSSFDPRLKLSSTNDQTGQKTTLNSELLSLWTKSHRFDWFNRPSSLPSDYHAGFCYLSETSVEESILYSNNYLLESSGNWNGRVFSVVALWTLDSRILDQYNSVKIPTDNDFSLKIANLLNFYPEYIEPDGPYIYLKGLLNLNSDLPAIIENYEEIISSKYLYGLNMTNLLSQFMLFYAMTPSYDTDLPEREDIYRKFKEEDYRFDKVLMGNERDYRYSEEKPLSPKSSEKSSQKSSEKSSPRFAHEIRLPLKKDIVEDDHFVIDTKFPFKEAKKVKFAEQIDIVIVNNALSPFPRKLKIIESKYKYPKIKINRNEHFHYILGDFDKIESTGLFFKWNEVELLVNSQFNSVGLSQGFLENLEESTNTSIFPIHSPTLQLCIDEEYSAHYAGSMEMENIEDYNLYLSELFRSKVSSDLRSRELTHFAIRHYLWSVGASISLYNMSNLTDDRTSGSLFWTPPKLGTISEEEEEVKTRLGDLASSIIYSRKPRNLTFTISAEGVFQEYQKHARFSEEESIEFSKKSIGHSLSPWASFRDESPSRLSLLKSSIWTISITLLLSRQVFSQHYIYNHREKDYNGLNVLNRFTIARARSTVKGYLGLSVLIGLNGWLNSILGIGPIDKNDPIKAVSHPFSLLQPLLASVKFSDFIENLEDTILSLDSSSLHKFLSSLFLGNSLSLVSNLSKIAIPQVMFNWSIRSVLYPYENDRLILTNLINPVDGEISNLSRMSNSIGGATIIIHPYFDYYLLSTFGSLRVSKILFQFCDYIFATAGVFENRGVIRDGNIFQSKISNKREEMKKTNEFRINRIMSEIEGNLTLSTSADFAKNILLNFGKFIGRHSLKKGGMGTSVRLSKKEETTVEEDLYNLSYSADTDTPFDSVVNSQLDEKLTKFINLEYFTQVIYIPIGKKLNDFIKNVLKAGVYTSNSEYIDEDIHLLFTDYLKHYNCSYSQKDIIGGSVDNFASYMDIMKRHVKCRDITPEFTDWLHFTLGINKIPSHPNVSQNWRFLGKTNLNQFAFSRHVWTRVDFWREYDYGNFLIADSEILSPTPTEVYGGHRRMHNIYREKEEKSCMYYPWYSSFLSLRNLLDEDDADCLSSSFIPKDEVFGGLSDEDPWSRTNENPLVSIGVSNRQILEDIKILKIGSVESVFTNSRFDGDAIRDVKRGLHKLSKRNYLHHEHSVNDADLYDYPKPRRNKTNAYEPNIYVPYSSILTNSVLYDKNMDRIYRLTSPSGDMESAGLFGPFLSSWYYSLLKQPSSRQFDDMKVYIFKTLSNIFKNIKIDLSAIILNISNVEEFKTKICQESSTAYSPVDQVFQTEMLFGTIDISKYLQDDSFLPSSRNFINSIFHDGIFKIVSRGIDIFTLTENEFNINIKNQFISSLCGEVLNRLLPKEPKLPSSKINISTDLKYYKLSNLTSPKMEYIKSQIERNTMEFIKYNDIVDDLSVEIKYWENELVRVMDRVVKDEDDVPDDDAVIVSDQLKTSKFYTEQIHSKILGYDKTGHIDKVIGKEIEERKEELLSTVNDEKKNIQENYEECIRRLNILKNLIVQLKKEGVYLNNLQVAEDTVLSDLYNNYVEEVENAYEIEKVEREGRILEYFKKGDEDLFNSPSFQSNIFNPMLSDIERIIETTLDKVQSVRNSRVVEDFINFENEWNIPINDK